MAYNVDLYSNASQASLGTRGLCVIAILAQVRLGSLTVYLIAYIQSTSAAILPLGFTFAASSHYIIVLFGYQVTTLTVRKL